MFRAHCKDNVLEDLKLFYVPKKRLLDLSKIPLHNDDAERIYRQRNKNDGSGKHLTRLLESWCSLLHSDAGSFVFVYTSKI